jgi:Smr domain-containing protein
MSANLVIVNLETGLPDRVQALERIKVALTQARKNGTTVLKIVHGYGSSGVGGILRPVVRNFLRQAKEKREIRLFVNGESFSSFDQRSKDLLAQAPQLLLDRDLGRANKGITLVLI